ncbi:hypothetical protein HYW94_00735 [Candidatus Uhrbacteria bacterium]|nr:hypothetical protein [Candidatus Uhrbacteria bacterium]
MKQAISFILGTLLIIIAIEEGGKSLASACIAFAGLAGIIFAIVSSAMNSIQRSFERMIGFDE